MKNSKLSEKAMLVHLRISLWSGRKKDRNVTSEVLTRKKAKEDCGAWWSYLIPQREIVKIHTAQLRVRIEFHKLTLPWFDGGVRILPADMFLEYTSRMRKVVKEFNEVIDEFLKHYPQYVREAKERLGDLFDGQKLPSKEDVQNRFRVHQDIIPVPSSDDFRVNLNNEEVKKIKEQMDKSLRNLTEKAMGDLWVRFSELIEKIQTTLNQSDKKFKNSLIINLQDFCKLIPKMNITNDASLEEMRNEVLKTLASLDSDVLRGNKQERSKAAKKAKNILIKMKGYKGI